MARDLDQCVDADRSLTLVTQLLVDRNVQHLASRLDKIEEAVHSHSLDRSFQAETSAHKERLKEGETQAKEQLGDRLRRRSSQMTLAQRATKA